MNRRMADPKQVVDGISGTLDLRAMLTGIVDAATELVPCSLAAISLWDEERGMLTLEAARCELELALPIGKSYPPGNGYTGWLVRHKEPVLVPDMENQEDIGFDVLPRGVPHKAYLGLPLIAGVELVGALVLIHDRAGAFDREDLRLLEGLRDQAAPTIYNATLREELARRQRELTALNAVAAASNRALELETLLADAVEQVIECLGGDAGGIRLLDPVDRQLVLSHTQGMSEECIAAVGRLGLGEGIVGDVALTGEPALLADLREDPRPKPKLLSKLREEGLRSFAVVPLCSREEVVGTMGVVSRTRGAFGRADVKLLTAMGHQIGSAIERARLHQDLAQRARELEASHAVAAAVNRPGELNEILGEGLRQALAVTGLEMGAIFVRDRQAGILRLCCHQGMSSGFVNWIQDHVEVKTPTIWRLVEGWASDQPVDIEEIELDADNIPDELRAEAIRLTADVPLFAEGEVVGILTVATRAAHLFTPEEQSLLQAIGYQLGTAITNAELRQEALDSERLAALGRVAAGVAHELRSPLGGIMRSAEFLARPELSELTRQQLSSAIVAMAHRLINTSQELLDYARGGRMALHRAPCPLPAFLEEVLEVLRLDFSDRGIAVETQWRYSGAVSIDSDRMTQVVYNIAANARDAMPRGGQLTIATERAGDWVLLRFTDTGPGVPIDLRERIFEPFVSHGKEEGAGLGLAIAQRIVEEHGGEIELESPPEGGARFTVRLPLG